MSARPRVLHVLSAGAAKALVQSQGRGFEDEAAVAVEATFDSAGAIRNAFDRGVACDVVILPAPMLDALASQRRIDGESIAPLGLVPTGIAVASGDPRSVMSAEELSPSANSVPRGQRSRARGVRGGHSLAAEAFREMLVDATALFCPDTLQATAGIHFAGVLRTLGILDTSREKLREYPNGARAMAALAEHAGARAIGCTQITEILYTPGVELVTTLPAPFELTTLYAVAVSSSAAEPPLARAFAARLTGPEAHEQRREGGFLDRSA